jgi:DMSO/TMAO reductase YedYZ heme-binding membrane subunit
LVKVPEKDGGSSRRVDWRYLVVCVGLVAIASLAGLSRHAGAGWEIGCGAGLLATIGSLALFALPVRPRESIPPAPLSIERHRLLGFTVLALCIAHAGVLILVDHPVVEYLMPTMPWYQAAGVLALLLLVALGLTSTRDSRRRLWASHRDFQAIHILLSIAALVLITVHVIATARYTHGWPAVGIYLATSVAALGMLLRQRKGARANIGGHDLIGRAAFGRHSRLVVVSIVLACAGVALMLPRLVGPTMRASPLKRAQRLSLSFPHEKHSGVNCLECHHNFVDQTGHSACISCHLRPGGAIKMAIEPRFHGFCLECHRDAARFPDKHGPVAGCTICHHDAGTPAAGR